MFYNLLIQKYRFSLAFISLQFYNIHMKQFVIFFILSFFISCQQDSGSNDSLSTKTVTSDKTKTSTEIATNDVPNTKDTVNEDPIDQSIFSIHDIKGFWYAISDDNIYEISIRISDTNNYVIMYCNGSWYSKGLASGTKAQYWIETFKTNKSITKLIIPDCGSKVVFTKNFKDLDKYKTFIDYSVSSYSEILGSWEGEDETGMRIFLKITEDGFEKKFSKPLTYVGDDGAVPIDVVLSDVKTNLKKTIIIIPGYNNRFYKM